MKEASGIGMGVGIIMTQQYSRLIQPKKPVDDFRPGEMIRSGEQRFLSIAKSLEYEISQSHGQMLLTDKSINGKQLARMFQWL